jgi:hypothetical protein
LEFGIVSLGESHLSPCQSALELVIGNVAEFPIPIPIPVIWNLELSSWEYLTSPFLEVLECWNWERSQLSAPANRVNGLGQRH